MVSFKQVVVAYARAPGDISLEDRIATSSGEKTNACVPQMSE
jgi:hypothetical protein